MKIGSENPVFIRMLLKTFLVDLVALSVSWTCDGFPNSMDLG